MNGNLTMTLDANDPTVIDPGVKKLLDRKADRVAEHTAYEPVTTSEVTTNLERFFAAKSIDGQVREVERMGGGASKEQFSFLLGDGSTTERYVLRIDPDQTAAETDRRRESEALNAYSDELPAPRAAWLDETGEHFGHPAMIMNFIPGVTKPTAKESGVNVTGLGTFFPVELRGGLAPQFVANLAKMHNVDWRSKDLPSFSAPTPGTTEAALWQVNWMSRVWHDDHIQASPIIALTERWLREHLPVCEDPVLVHGDFRTGNFLFDEATGRMTAILDWEWVHLGDFHEDLGWQLQSLYATKEDGRSFACGLMERESLIVEYERESNRTVDPDTLLWYEIYCAWKCFNITLATSIKAARDGANHQDVLLSWMAPAGYRFATELAEMIRRYEEAR